MARPNDATRRITITIYDTDGTTILGTTTRTIYAAGLWNTQTIAITGDVVGQGTTDFADGAGLTFGVTLQADTVGESHLKVGAVTLNRISSSAKTNNAVAGDEKLITSGGVRNAIDNALAAIGVPYGPKTVDEINALTNIPVGSTVHVVAGGTATVITDSYPSGGITARVGMDLKYHVAGDVHGWYSLDGEFKQIQPAVTPSDFVDGGTSTDFTFVSSVVQDANGDITVTIKTLPLASPSGTGAAGNAGLMSAADKAKVNDLDNEITANDVQTAWDAWTPSST